jgi:hypothetical protein
MRKLALLLSCIGLAVYVVAAFSELLHTGEASVVRVLPVVPFTLAVIALVANVPQWLHVAALITNAAWAVLALVFGVIALLHESGAHMSLWFVLAVVALWGLLPGAANVLALNQREKERNASAA